MTPGFFTIKWLMPAGYTHFYQAGNLTVIPQTVDDPNRAFDVMASPKSVNFTDATGLECSIDSGVVYILNDKGTTIDKVAFPLPVAPPDNFPGLNDPQPLPLPVLDPSVLPGAKQKARRQN